jgi:hypothetical protein
MLYHPSAGHEKRRRDTPLDQRLNESLIIPRPLPHGAQVEGQRNPFTFPRPFPNHLTRSVGHAKQRKGNDAGND